MPGTMRAGGNMTDLFALNISITPASVNANTTSAQTFTVKGLLTTDIIAGLTLNGAQTAGIGAHGAYVSAADTLSINFMNATGSSATPAAGTYQLIVGRPVGTIPSSAL